MAPQAPKALDGPFVATKAFKRVGPFGAVVMDLEAPNMWEGLRLILPQGTEVVVMRNACLHLRSNKALAAMVHELRHRRLAPKVLDEVWRSFEVVLSREVPEPPDPSARHPRAPVIPGCS